MHAAGLRNFEPLLISHTVFLTAGSCMISLGACAGGLIMVITKTVCSPALASFADSKFLDFSEHDFTYK